MTSLSSKYLDLLQKCDTLKPPSTPTSPNGTKSNLETGHERWRTVNALRRLVLLEGMPKDANDLNSDDFGRCSLRGLVWKALLGIGTVDVQEYTDIVKTGPSLEDSRVREDAKRTFAKNPDFVNKVPLEKLVRVLNAYIHSAANKKGIYSQSMSLLLAPFLYVMPEPDAFHCFRAYLKVKIPEYVRKYSGAKRGCRLLDVCLKSTDRPLYDVFLSRGLNAEVYAFPNISSLGACVPPICDTVRLWDIQLAFGAHMHILFTLSRLLLASERILKAATSGDASPIVTRELERGLGANVDDVIAKAISLVSQLEPGIYWHLTSHAVNPAAGDIPLSNSDLESHMSSLFVSRRNSEEDGSLDEKEQSRDTETSTILSDRGDAEQNDSPAESSGKEEEGESTPAPD